MCQSSQSQDENVPFLIMDARYDMAYFWLLVERALCAEAVGAASSEDSSFCEHLPCSVSTIYHYHIRTIIHRDVAVVLHTWKIIV